MLVSVACAVAIELHGSEAKDEKAYSWPAFQGPPTPELKADTLPLVWAPDKNIAWKAEIPGYGQSSPVIWGSRLFVTSISGKMKENCHVCAIDLNTGKVEWQRDFPSGSQIENSNYVSKAAPTPVVDENGLVVFFEVGNLVALKHDGEPIWSRNLVEEHGELPSRHGLGSSLVQTEQLVFVWIERQTDPYLLAVDKVTGKTAWKVPGLGAASWSTPALVPVNTEDHLVVSGSGHLAGYDPKDGKRLWSFEGLSGNSIPTPQPTADGNFLLGATLARGEEGAGKAAASNGIIRITKNDSNGFQVDFKWRCKRATSSFGSPIMHEGLTYFVNSAGVLFCVDAESGEEVYSERIADSIWATPLAIGNRIYFAGKSGNTTVVEAGREFRVLAQNQLWNSERQEPESSKAAKAQADARPGASEQNQRVQYAIATVPGRLLIRTGDAVYCISQQ